MVVLTVLLALLLALVVIVIGLAAVQQLPPSLQVRDRLGVGPTWWRVVGGLELVAAAALILGATVPLLGLALAALGGLVVVVLGALVLHIRARDGAGAVPAVLVLAWTLVLVVLLPAYRG